jgi:hypothetical protein
VLFLVRLAALPSLTLQGAGAAVLATACSALGSEASPDGRCPASSGSSLLQLRTAALTRSSVHAEAGVHTHSETAGKLISASQARRAQHAIFAGGLHRSLAELGKSQNVSNKELDNLITRFINHHAADEDKCPARLMEAKHQLNDLHKAIQELADLINTAETDVHVISGDLEDVLEQIKDIDKQKTQARKKADDDKDDNSKMLVMLRQEMEEMRQLAQPGVTMSMSGRTEGKDGGPGSLLQLAAFSPPQQSSRNVDDVQHLVLQTKDVATAMTACFMELRQQRDEAQQQLLLFQGSAPALEALAAEATKHSAANLSFVSTRSVVKATAARNCSINTTVDVQVGTTSRKVTFGRAVANGTAGYYNCDKIDAAFGGVLMLHCADGLLTADPRGCFRHADEQHCLAQRQQLEDTYVKAYVQLARLIQEYEDLASPDDDGDVVQQVERAKKEPLQDRADKLAAEQGEKMRQLEDLRPRLEDMLLAESKLRQHIKKLAEECQQLPDTTSGLQKIRDAILALEACPGLGRVQFHVPLWAGEWVEILQDGQKTDKNNDAAALEACVAKYGSGSGIRVAEVSEILAHSVEGMPRNNTAPVALMGACPHCEGADDASTGQTNAEGHSRICWDPAAKLNQASRRIDCSKGLKAVMCVYDRGDIRKVKWSLTTTTTAAPFAPLPSK